jgi:hypothetical protein
MTNNSNSKLAAVTALRKSGSPMGLLGARGVLLDAAEAIEANSIGAGRAMTADEQRNFDDYLSQLRSIGEDLAEYKRQRIADAAGSGLRPVLPF